MILTDYFISDNAHFTIKSGQRMCTSMFLFLRKFFSQISHKRVSRKNHDDKN